MRENITHDRSPGFIGGTQVKPFLRAACATILLLLAFGCSSASVSFDDAPLGIRTTQQDLTPRISQDGMELTCGLTANGLNGQPIDISCYDDQNRFLAVTEVTPKDGVHMSDIKLLIPNDRIFNRPEKLAFNLFVTPSSDRSQYLEKGHWDLVNEYHGVRVVWDVKNFEEGVDVGGEEGIRLTMHLEIAGFKDHTIQAVLLVQNPDLSDLSAGDGGPVEINVCSLTPRYDDSVWGDSDNNFVISIPYSRLASLSPTKEISLTPSIRDGDTLYSGNVHVSSLAGGTIEEVQAQAEKDVAGYDQQIQDLQQRIDELNQERGK